MAGVLAVVTFLSLVVTKLVDTIRNAVDPDVPPRIKRVVWNLLGFGLGIAIALIFHVNFIEAALQELGASSGEVNDVRGTAGEILTGFFLGAGASVWHELLSWWSSKSPKTPQ